MTRYALLALTGLLLAAPTRAWLDAGRDPDKLVAGPPLEQAEACEWSMRFKSIIGFGRASLVEGLAAKREALAVIMAHYAEAPYTFPDNKVAATAVIRVDIDAMTGKQSGF